MTVPAGAANHRSGAARSWAVDALIVVVVPAFAVSYLVQDAPRPMWVAITGVACLTIPLLVRRRWPVPVLTAVLMAVIGFGIWHLQLAGSMALPVALYTVAARGTRKQAYAGAAILEILVLIAAARLSGPALLLPLVLFSGMVAAALGLGLYSATRAAYVAELLDRAERLERERERTNALAAIAERTRIAREMHDIVAHHLTVIVALSDGATRLADADPQRASEAMANVSATGRAALRDTRRLLGVLSDGTTPDGAAHDPAAAAGQRQPIPTISDLDAVVDQVRATGLAVNYTVDGKAGQLPIDTQVAAYRLVQEALTNVIKHAHPGARATVYLSYRPDRLGLRVEDDGAGQTITDQRHPGRGLTGMAARITAAGGELDCGPRPGGGWRVHADIPLTDRLEQQIPTLPVAAAR